MALSPTAGDPPRAGKTPGMVVASDKYRGTASATEICGAVLAAAARAGWAGASLPMADGGEGLLETFGGARRTARVTGPHGRIVEAEWHMLESAAPGRRPVAIVEMARASGLALAGGPARNDPEAATTAGTGELILAAARGGAGQIVVGCGGSATTDGGLGAFEVLRGRPELVGVELLAACDVTTTFLDAARVFGPQKGADEVAVERLTKRLEALALVYLETCGVDVTAIEGTGAAGGLAGAIAALGGTIASGFELVATLHDLDSALSGASLVVTGEGRLDATSLAGKVVGGVLRRAALLAVPALVIVGDAEPAIAGALPAGAWLVSLTERYGRARAIAEPLTLVEEVAYDYLCSLSPPRSASSISACSRPSPASSGWNDATTTFP